MLKKNGYPDPTTVHSFEQHWPNIEPITKKLILNERINTSEWQDLFYDVHMVCSWDQEGPKKLLKNLDCELRDSYVRQARSRLLSIDCDQQQLKEYVVCWSDFKRHCDRFPVAFQQLDLATRTTITQLKPSYPRENKSTSTLSPSNGTKNEDNTFKYHSRKRNDSTVRRLMLKLWDEQIVRPLDRRLLESADTLIWFERNGNIIDSRLIIGLRESFNHLEELRDIYPNMKSYIHHFKEIYIKSIEIFYTTRADEYFRSHEVTDYIEWALGKLDIEEQKAIQYLEMDPSAMLKAAEACRRVLVEKFVEQVLEASRQYINSNDIDNMGLIYRFFGKLEGVTERYLERLSNHMITAGLDCLMASTALIATKPDKFFEKLLDIHNQYSKVVSISFDNDERAKVVLDKAFSVIVNDTRLFNDNQRVDTRDTSENNTPIKIPTTTSKNPAIQPESRCAELVANYCNLLLRRSTYSRKLTADDLINRLNEVLLVVKLLKSKESFIKFHKMQLMRRLILDASISLEREEEFVNQLKDLTEAPIEQINELLRMFRDLKASESLRSEFMNKTVEQMNNNSTISNNNNNNNNNNLISDITSQVSDCLKLQHNNNGLTTATALRDYYEPISVKVLNPSAWTKMNDRYPMKLSPEVSSIIPNFESYYKSQFEGRKLDWCHNLSNGIVEFSNDSGGKFDLEVTGAQLSILSTFNDQPRASKTLKEMEMESNLSSVELRRTLWSLVSNPKLKVQIMKCQPEANDPRDLENEEAKYAINHEFVLMKNGKPQSKGRVCLIGRLQI